MGAVDTAAPDHRQPAVTEKTCEHCGNDDAVAIIALCGDCLHHLDAASTQPDGG